MTAILPMTLLYAYVWAAAVVVHSRRLGWWLSLASVTAFVMAGQAYLFYVNPHLGLPLAVGIVVAWGLAAAAYTTALAVLARRGGLPRLGGDRWFRLGVSLVVPVLALGQYLLKLVRSGGDWIGWGMINDEVQKNVQTLEILRAHGMPLGIKIGDPLTIVLNASWGAWFAGDDHLGRQLRHVVQATELSSYLFWLLVCFVGAIWATRFFARRWAVAAAAILVAAFPLGWTGAVTGYSDFGFMNIAPAILLLLMTWIAWTCRKRSVGVTAITLVMLGYACTQAWLPTVVVPAVAAVALLVEFVVAKGRLTVRQWAGLGVSAVGALVCTLAVAANMAPGNGITESLSWNGGFPDYYWPVAVALLTVLTIGYATGPYPERWAAVGLWATVLASIGLLVLDRLAYGNTGWGYYPAKFTWLAVIAVTIIALPAYVKNVVGLLDRAGAKAVAGALAWAVVAGLTMFTQYHPALQKDKSEYSPLGLAHEIWTVSTMPGFIEGDRTENLDYAARYLFDILDESPNSLAVGLFGGSGSDDEGVLVLDGWIDFWLFQYHIEPDGTQPFWWFAFGGAGSVDEPGDVSETNPEFLCTMLRSWAEPRVFWTTSPTLEDTVRAECTDRDFSVRVVSPAELLAGLPSQYR